MFARVEVVVKPEFDDSGAQRVLRDVELAAPEVRRLIRWARLIDVYWLEVDCSREALISAVQQIYWDRVQTWLLTGDLIPSAAGRQGGMSDLLDSAPYRGGQFYGLEKRFRPGVTDNVGRTSVEAMEIVLGEKLPEARAAYGQLLVMEGAELGDKALDRVAEEVFCNDLIESWTVYEGSELTHPGRFHGDSVKRVLPQVKLRRRLQVVDEIKLQGLKDKDLTQMSQDNLWALSLEEMKAIQGHYGDEKLRKSRTEQGLPADPTDVEMEVLAQTWSEHCKHKIFNAEISYKSTAKKDDPGKDIPAHVDSLFKQTISGTTQKIQRNWLLSVFSDNAGIVALDEEDAFCIKVETHNSPSALDPYGGALTGIVGVNRDILGCGLGARPIFNTDVFCVAPPHYMRSLPERIMHPRRILEGVRSGVEAGGNKSGIPTVNGALCFDERFLGKPLVYCGTGGILPRKVQGRATHTKEVKPGDHICMVGGRIGKDGIHGATFSSLAMDESSPSSAVQLGDPITQKRAADFLLEARDQSLYRTLTDNGAGGLSSSVGEMAELSNGARLDVSRAKTKYPGLKPFELVVSESQERMTVAVPPSCLKEFLDLAERRGSEVSVLGEFTNSGYFEITYGDEVVGLLDLEFLHKGVPRLKLNAKWEELTPDVGSIELAFSKEGGRHLQDLLSRPNIASKEWLIRQYDHEVQGSSVIKPLHTVAPGTPKEKSGPNDGAVIRPKPGSEVGITVGCGINPRLSDIDPYLMGQAVVDEALRNVLSVGAEFGKKDSVLALTDNFCWPDPVGDEAKAAWLVRACYGMQEAALALDAPFVSGKDSMKNDYRGSRDGKEIKISVPPTLLITAVGRLSDVKGARTSDFKRDGDRIYLLGLGDFALTGSELHNMYLDQLKERGGGGRRVVLPTSKGEENLHIPKPDWPLARKLYSWLGGSVGKRQGMLRSVHDVSEGGILTCLAESLIARDLGARITVPEGQEIWSWSFGEGFHSFVATVAEDSDFSLIEGEWKKLEVPFMEIGRVTGDSKLEVRWEEEDEEQVISVSTSDLARAWQREGYWQ